MIACALTGPISGKASSSSLVAVLILTAASANAENSSVTSNSTNLFIHPSEGKWTLGCTGVSGLGPDAYNGCAMLRVDRGWAKKRLHALRDALSDIAHRRVVPGGAQPAEIGLGVALVLVLQSGGKSDVFDRARAMQRLERQRRDSLGDAAGIDRFGRHRVECRRAAATQIEDSRALGAVEKVEIDLHNIVDAHKVAALLTGGVASRALEKLHLAGGPILLKKMPYNRRHPAFVSFARTINVEVSEARNLRRAIREEPADVLIEQRLRIAVDIERRLARSFLAKHRARTVDGGRRSVEKRNVVILAMLQQRHRIAVIVGKHEPAVGFHGVRARALMQHRRDVVVEGAFGEPRQELVLVEIIGDVAIDEIAESIHTRQAVDRENTGLSASVQCADQARSDEAGGTGDDNVQACSPRSVKLQFDVDLADFRRHEWHARRDRAEQLVANSARRGRDVVDRQSFAPEHGRAADARLRYFAQVDGHHVHGDASRGAHFLAAEQQRRPVGRMARTAVGVPAA